MFCIATVWFPLMRAAYNTFICSWWFCVIADWGMAVGQLKDTTNILVKTTKLTITSWSNGFAPQVSHPRSYMHAIMCVGAADSFIWHRSIRRALVTLTKLALAYSRYMYCVLLAQRQWVVCGVQTRPGQARETSI